MADPSRSVCRDLWAYPVIELGRPRIRTCCKRPGEIITKSELEQLGTDVFLNLPGVLDERRRSMAGERVERCDLCWRLEDQGLRSFRLGAPDFQFHFNNDEGVPVSPGSFRSFEHLIANAGDILHSDKPNKLDLSLGTYCDQKCIYCNQDYSTLWEAENRRYGAKSGPSINTQTLDGYFDRFLEWFDTIYQYLERIALLGGEPTFSPLFDPLIDRMIHRLGEKHHPNCTISIVSNLNWKPEVLDRLLEIRSRLPNVGLVLEVSMESVGARAEYIRNGVSYDRFISNLREVAKRTQIGVNLITTINALCVSSIGDYLMDVRDIEIETGRDFGVIPNRLVKPAWLGMGILDMRHAVYIDDTVDWLVSTYGRQGSKGPIISVLEDVSREISQPRDDRLLGYFARWITEIDRRRMQDFSRTFPELATLISEGITIASDSYPTELIDSWG